MGVYNRAVEGGVNGTLHEANLCAGRCGTRRRQAQVRRSWHSGGLRVLCLHSSQRQEEAGRAQGRALHHSHCKCAVGSPLCMRKTEEQYQ